MSSLPDLMTFLAKCEESTREIASSFVISVSRFKLNSPFLKSLMTKIRITNINPKRNAATSGIRINESRMPLIPSTVKKIAVPKKRSARIKKITSFVFLFFSLKRKASRPFSYLSFCSSFCCLINSSASLFRAFSLPKTSCFLVWVSFQREIYFLTSSSLQVPFLNLSSSVFHFSSLIIAFSLISSLRCFILMPLSLTALISERGGTWPAKKSNISSVF